MTLTSKKDLESALQHVESAQTYLIGLTNSLNRTHKASLVNPRLFVEEEWKRHEFSIHQNCSTISSILSEIQQGLALLDKDHELNKIYHQKNISGQYELWKLTAENTIKAIELRRQLKFSLSFSSTFSVLDTLAGLEKKIAEHRYYLEWVIGRFPNSLNFFLNASSELLQRQAFIQLHTYYNQYTHLLNHHYLVAKKNASWSEAHKMIDKLSHHFEQMLLDSKRYEPKNNEKIEQMTSDSKRCLL